MIRALFLSVLVIACAEPSSAPATAPTGTVSLDVPPLPPPKASAERPMARQANPPAAGDDDASLLPRDPAAAEGAFQDAKRAMAAGDDAKARALFMRSYRLDPAIGTLLNLALVEERLGMKDKAIEHYQAAYDASMKEGRRDRAALAKDRMDALKGRP